MLSKKSVILTSLVVFFIALFFLTNPPSSPTGQAIASEPSPDPDAIIKVTITTSDTALQQELLAQDESKDYALVNAISTEMTGEEYTTLKQDASVTRINQDYLIEQVLVDTVRLTNASNVHSLQFNGINLKGKGRSACVIDSGVSNHPAFETRIINEACYCSVTQGANQACCPNGASVQINGTIGDNNGHGTHISGIIASNDNTYTGIAPEANIVSVKVLNSSGHGTTSDLLSALEYCITNAQTFNISAISMSLGCAGGFTGTCDTSTTCDSDLAATLINTATANNITVIASSGNSGSTSQLLSPACIQNTLAVGSTTKSDSISGFTNRNNLLDLLAPGSNINSLYLNNGFATGSGTSQAAPHVAGAVLLLNQYAFAETTSVLTPSLLQTTLQTTGFSIFDGGTGLTFSRINLLPALQSLDHTAPTLLITSPLNTTYSTNIFLSLNYTALDPFLATVTYQLDSGSITPLTTNLIFNTTDGTHTLRLTANDTNGNTQTQTVSFIVSTTPSLTINSPLSQAYNSNSILINVTGSENTASIIFFNETRNETYTSPVTRTYSAGNHTLTFFTTSTQGTMIRSTINFSIDTTSPIITLHSPQSGIYSNQFILINLSMNEAGTLAYSNGTTTFNYSTPTFASFQQGVTAFIATATDLAGNTNTATINFTIDTNGPTITSISPLTGQDINKDFIINVSIQDSQGVNAQNVFYKYENTTGSSAWIPMTNVSKDYWHAPLSLSDLSETTYTLKVNASDLTNANTVAVLTFEKDTTPPGFPSPSVSPSTTSATISWTTSESANTSINYGTTLALGTIRTRNTAATHSFSLIDLAANQEHFYNATSCDGAGNCRTLGPLSFSTTQVSSGGSSSGGASGGGGGGGGGSGNSRSTLQANEESLGVETAAGPISLPAELEKKFDDLFDPSLKEQLSETTEYSIDKKLLTTKDSSTVRLKLTYTGQAAQDLFYYIDVPKTFAEQAKDITVTAEGKKLLTVVKEDPSYLVRYENVDSNGSYVLELTTQKVLTPAILDEFKNNNIYISKAKVPDISAIKGAQATLNTEHPTFFRYWWILVIILLILIALVFTYRDEIKYRLQSSNKPHEDGYEK